MTRVKRLLFFDFEDLRIIPGTWSRRTEVSGVKIGDRLKLRVFNSPRSCISTNHHLDFDVRSNERWCTVNRDLLIELVRCKIIFKDFLNELKSTFGLPTEF